MSNSGKVSKMIDSRHANIKFENGTKQENMSVRNVLKINGPSPYITVESENFVVVVVCFSFNRGKKILVIIIMIIGG